MSEKVNNKNIKPFDGTKYSVWKYRVFLVLDEQNVLNVVQNERPVNDELNEVWLAAEKTAKRILVENMDDSMFTFFKRDDTAREIISKFDALYERESLTTQLTIEKNLLSLKFNEDVPLLKHFMVFEQMLQDVQAAGSEINERNKIARLLLTLPRSYDPIVTAIQTTLSDNLNLALVKTNLLEYEVKLNNERKDTSSKILQASAINNFQNKKQNYQKNNFNKNYNKYNNNYKKHNKNNSRFYQQNNNQSHQSRYKNNVKINSRRNYNYPPCEYCGRRNHDRTTCYYKKKNEDNEEQTQLQHIEVTENSSKFAFMCGDDKYIEQNNDLDKVIFLLDSGATDHVTNRADIFTNVKELEIPTIISVAKKEVSIKAEKIGTVEVLSNEGVEGTLKNVLYAPDVPYSLLSVRRIQESGMNVLFMADGQVKITKGAKIIATGKSKHNLIIVDFTIIKNKICQVEVKRNLYKLWHARLGHLSKGKFLEIKRNNLFQNNQKLNDVNPIDEICEACVNGKQACLPFSKVKDKTHVTRPLFIIHTDVCGPITPTTVDDKNYFVTFIDQYTHYTVVYLLNRKSEVYIHFKDFVNKSESHHNLKIAHLYCDNGREYLSNEFKQFCMEQGIQYHLTVPYTPQQNSVAERMNRSLVEKARSLIHGANLIKDLWGEAILTATYLINLTPTKAVDKNKTPYELWHHRKPRLEHLRIFGSTVYIHDKMRKQKFDKKSTKGILIGYHPNGYKIFMNDSNKFIIARDVIIDEENFNASRPIVENDENENSNFKRQKFEEQLEVNNNNENKIDNVKIMDEVKDHQHETSSSYKNSHNDKNETVIRKSERIKQMQPLSYNEEICYHLNMQSVNVDIPNSYQEIKSRHDKNQWENAMKDEINSLIQNKTWDLVSIPENKNIIDCRWVYTIKNDEYGNKTKYKARLVAKGFSQQYLLDFDETFAPVARITTFRIVLAIANQYNLLIHQMDVKTAFLNGKLNEEIYMRIPDGIKAKENQVCKLNKALYGLKQAARCWFQLFDEVLKRHNFINSSADHCLYFLNKGHITKNIYVMIYVDDVLIATYEKQTMNAFKQYLKTQFSMVDMNEAKYFLGIKITRNNDIITIDQKKYLESILQKYKMSDCNPVNTPLPPKLNYEALNSNEIYEAPCKNLIGSLMYAMLCTRPDLCTSINILSRYQIKNNKELWQLLKRVLRYIKGSLNLKLIFKRNEYKNMLIGYADADWAGNEIDRRSTTGYLFKLFEMNTISWNSKRQNSVATSSTEAEYMALFEAVKEACWLKKLLKDIKIESLKPIKIFEDNNACIAIAKNPTDHKRSKHIDVKYHFIREKIESNDIILEYINTGEQVADAFTKSLPGTIYMKLRAAIGLKADV